MKLEEKEQDKFLKIEDALHKRVIGQEEAISAIAHAVRRSRAGIKDPRRPIGSFVFLGRRVSEKPLSEARLPSFCSGMRMRLYRSTCPNIWKNSMSLGSLERLRDMSDMKRAGSLPKGRRRPYSVILLDEIEKAHPDVFNLLLQLLEEGRLTDSFGRKVDFKNTVIIMTSNIGAEMLKKQGSLGFKSEKRK